MATYKDKFNEYIDKTVLNNEYYYGSTDNCPILEKTCKTLDKAIVSQLLYRVDPVVYEELFEKWCLSNLTNKGTI